MRLILTVVVPVCFTAMLLCGSGCSKDKKALWLLLIFPQCHPIPLKKIKLNRLSFLLRQAINN